MAYPHTMQLVQHLPLVVRDMQQPAPRNQGRRSNNRPHWVGGDTLSEYTTHQRPDGYPVGNLRALQLEPFIAWAPLPAFPADNGHTGLDVQGEHVGEVCCPAGWLPPRGAVLGFWGRGGLRWTRHFHLGLF